VIVDTAVALQLIAQTIPKVLTKTAVKSGFKRCGIIAGEGFGVKHIDGLTPDLNMDPITIHLSNSVLPELYQPTVYLPKEPPAQLFNPATDPESKVLMLADYLPQLWNNLSRTASTLQLLQMHQTIIRMAQACLQSKLLADREAAKMCKTRVKLASSADAVDVIAAVARRCKRWMTSSSNGSSGRHSGNTRISCKAVTHAASMLVPGVPKVPTSAKDAKAFLNRANFSCIGDKAQLVARARSALEHLVALPSDDRLQAILSCVNGSMAWVGVDGVLPVATAGSTQSTEPLLDDALQHLQQSVADEEMRHRKVEEGLHSQLDQLKQENQALREQSHGTVLTNVEGVMSHITTTASQEMDRFPQLPRNGCCIPRREASAEYADAGCCCGCRTPRGRGC